MTSVTRSDEAVQAAVQPVSSGHAYEVRLEGVGKYYAEAGGRHDILRDVNLVLEGGKFTALVGKSGSGKSTLLNLVSGVDRPDAGALWIGDIEVSALSEHHRSVFRRDHIGIVFQFFHLLPTLTVLENVMLPQELAGRPEAECARAALHMLEAVGLADRAQARPDHLSGGEQQRVAIARALAGNPRLVVADEPTGNLDPITGTQVLQLLVELTRSADTTLVVATHSQEVVELADRVYRVYGGQVVLETSGLAQMLTGEVSAPAQLSKPQRENESQATTPSVAT